MQNHLQEFTAFLGELNKESARGAVLISASMLDEILRRSILTYLVQHEDVPRLLDGFNAPLGSFSSRILVGLALGVLSEREYREFETIRRIRNSFAHDVHVSFEDARIRDLCDKLTMSASDYSDVSVDARGKFTTAAVALILHLTNRPHYASKRRLTFTSWPY